MFCRRHSSEGVDAKFGSTLPKDFAGEVVFDWIFCGRHFVFRTKNQRGRSFSCLNALKNKSLPQVHVDSQIKDSSNSFLRRHSSEGVDAKFSSTLPTDFAGEVIFDWIFWSL